MDPKQRDSFTGLLRSPAVLLNLMAPVVAFQALTRHGVSSVGALAISAAFPAAGGALVLLRRREADPLALLSLMTIAIGLVAAVAFHDGRVLLVKESVTTCVLGVVFLGSLLWRRPLIFTLRRRLYVSGDERDRTDYENLWDCAAVRAECRRTTALWGLVLLAESAARIGLSYLLPVGTMVTVSALIPIVTLAPLAVWTLRPRDRSEDRGPSPQRATDLEASA